MNPHMNPFVPELGTFRHRLRHNLRTTSRICCPMARRVNVGTKSVDDCQDCPFVSIVLENGVWCQPEIGARGADQE